MNELLDLNLDLLVAVLSKTPLLWICLLSIHSNILAHSTMLIDSFWLHLIIINR